MVIAGDGDVVQSLPCVCWLWTMQAFFYWRLIRRVLRHWLPLFASATSRPGYDILPGCFSHFYLTMDGHRFVPWTIQAPSPPSM
jgi:hypothetical protein